MTSSTPPYQQIWIQFHTQILSGELLIGTRLPTVRRLAADLGLAANTVGRAYKQLEASGLVRTGRRAGTVVIGNPDDLQRRAHVNAMSFAHGMQELGVDVETALAMVRAAYRESARGGEIDTEGAAL